MNSVALDSVIQTTDGSVAALGKIDSGIGGTKKVEKLSTTHCFDLLAQCLCDLYVTQESTTISVLPAVGAEKIGVIALGK